MATSKRITLLVLGKPGTPELSVLERLPSDSYDLLAVCESLDDFRAVLPEERLRSAEALLLCRLPGLPVGGERARQLELIPTLPALKWAHSTFAGVNHLLFPQLIESDVVVTNARGVFSDSLAEWAIFAMLWFAKNIVQMQAAVRRRQWDGAAEVEELRGRTLGVIGFGSIGRAAAILAKAHGMRVVALRRRPQLSAGDEILDGAYGPDGLLQLMADSDYVLMATPLTPETKGLVGPAAIAAMRPNGVLINLGRGQCLDEAALACALAEKRIRGAALDVFESEPLPQDSPLWDLENVLISPHCADRTKESYHQTMELFLDEAGRYAAGGTAALQNVVDKRAGY